MQFFDMTNDDLKQLAELCTVNKPTVVDSKGDITVKILIAEFLKNSITSITEIKRSSKARRDFLEMISCYQEILHWKKLKNKI
ncbi:hypothetical protein T12_12014 [Trichinella patagoniensis]|uniref:Uncharacterized protein n=1 Tax=Trichinella patagoniensis TaxID=990121 RepID=A0A0V0ZRV1_9BILA|nr:hypothetical protein T12_12014 [Trichinella patagoniensis]